MASRRDSASRKGGLTTLKLILIVIILLLVPTTMEQLSMHEETVRTVGRVCVGIALLVFLYGLFTKVLRLAGIVVLALIVASVLASEGVIDVPHLLDR
jgi:hypothetical protein